MISRVVYSPENSNIADPLSRFLPKDAKVTAPQHEEYVRFVIIDATMKVLTTPEKKELGKVQKAIRQGRFENCKVYIPVASELCAIRHIML